MDGDDDVVVGLGILDGCLLLSVLEDDDIVGVLGACVDTLPTLERVPRNNKYFRDVSFVYIARNASQDNITKNGYLALSKTLLRTLRNNILQ